MSTCVLFGAPASTVGSRVWRTLGFAARIVPAILELWAQRARTRQQLEFLDARLLSDIGLTRHDVVLETKKRFWQA
jgi:uncharacterized protein YjiS (DUF1127 family)